MGSEMCIRDRNWCGIGTSSGVGCLMRERLTVDLGGIKIVFLSMCACPQVAACCGTIHRSLVCAFTVGAHGFSGDDGQRSTRCQVLVTSFLKECRSIKGMVQLIVSQLTRE